ncbi:MAG: sulfurtransferase-like selenium metabolism protein YedF [Lachnospiraceae bacterium]|nr:sulfurtransferase-like selenium metabolism protein YedF [Lachnospiraceae bacterium]
MIQVNAMGDACPIPVVKTKNAIRDLAGSGVVETLVDNEIAVQNLTKMANQKGYGVKSEKLGENQYKVTMTIGEGAQMPEEGEVEVCLAEPGQKRKIVVAVSSSKMGEGDEELGKTLMKGFIYALGQQEILPETILFYNGGAALSCEDSPALEDLKSLEAQGVEILTCGTCLDFYNLKDKLRVGDVTNMYVIVEKMMEAHQIVKP